MPNKSRKSSIRTKANPTQYYRYPLAPRKTPLKAPTVGIFDEPHACVKINNEWLSHILGVLGVLTEEDAWSGLEIDRYWAQQEIEKLLNALKDDSQCEPCADRGCVRIDLFDPRIEWLPNDPFRTPELVPTGYLFPPWYITPFNNVIGAVEGDIATDLARITGVGGALFGNLPRFRLTVQGSGVVQFRFVNLFAGGFAAVQVDGRLDSLSFIDLNRDTLSIPPESGNPIIVEFELTDDGEHFIDVSAYPRGNDEPEALGFGMAIREIRLCGFVQPCPSCPECPECPDPDCENCSDCGDSDCDDCSECAEDCSECEECE